MKFLKITFRISILLVIIILGFTAVFPEWLELKDMVLSEMNDRKQKGNKPSTRPFIISATPHTSVTFYEQQLWVQATCAIVTEMNKGNHLILGGHYKTIEANVLCAKEILDKWWNINTKEELFSTLNWLANDGHRREFNELSEKLSTLSNGDILSLKKYYSKNTSILNKIKIVTEYKTKLGSKSILGWDYVRYVLLCGWGYTAGLMSKEEVWRQLMPVGQILQQTFDSWEDLGRNYIIGRRYWSKTQSDRQGELVENIYNKLISDSNSPWNRINWNLNLFPNNSNIDQNSLFIPILDITDENFKKKGIDQ